MYTQATKGLKKRRAQTAQEPTQLDLVVSVQAREWNFAQRLRKR